MRIRLTIAMLMLCAKCFAQDEPLFSHYMFNSISFNPAYAGNKDVLQLQSTYRMQWIGIEGAPKTLQFNIDAPVYKKISIGFDLINDKIGDFNSTKLYGSYAYRFNINSKSRISLGVATGLEMRRLIANDKLIIDPSFNTSNYDFNSFDVRAGLYYSNKDLYVGISSTSVLDNNFNIYSSPNSNRNYYLTSGYLFKISDLTVLYPSILYKDDFNKSSSFNFTGLVGYNSTFWAGISYKTGFDFFSKIDSKYGNSTANVMGLLFDLELNDHYRIGYNFDYSLSVLRNADKGSHEVSLSYYFKSKKSNRMLNPRYL